MSYKLEVDLKEIMNIYSKNHKVGNKNGIKRAYHFAEEKHAGVTRGTGEPYINHVLRTARSVAEWGAESEVIMAALLHDVVEDCDVTLDDIEKEFGSIVRDIVDTVTSLSDKDFDSTNGTPTKAQKDLLSDAKLQSKMTSKALLVKIADRIDNLNTLSGVKEEKRIPKAEHTKAIIIPMARLAKADYLADILASFPDGSVCTHCVRLPFVPGEHVDVKVVNGGFYLTGSKFYKEWGDAEDLIENARKYHTPEETESIIKEYLKEHASEDGCALSFIQNHVLPRDTLMEMIPQSLYDRMKYVADYLLELIEREERQNKVDQSLEGRIAG